MNQSSLGVPTGIEHNHVPLPAVAETANAPSDADFIQRRSEILRRPPPVKFGAIDVGTNSIHLVMVEVSSEGDFRILGRDKEVVQLGRGGFVEHILTESAMQTGLAALTRFVKMARLKEVSRLRAVATSAVREAHNGGDFVERVRGELGLDLHVLSTEEEARLIYVAVRHALSLGGADNLIVDVGGGSVEVIVGDANRAENLSSVKLGGLRLAELFMPSDPPSQDEIKAMRRHIQDSLEPITHRIGARKFSRCIATSGSFENIATICAHRHGLTDIETPSQLRVSRAELKELLSDLTGMDSQARKQIPGMDERRVDTIIPAAAIFLSIYRLFDVSEIEYCDMALREGIIIDYIASRRAYFLARATWPNPRMRSVVFLAERCGYNRAHAEQVQRLAVSLFDQLVPLHHLDNRYRELLGYACMLHDIGYLISHQAHHKHAYYLIRNGGLQGFTEQEVEIIAKMARYHRKARPKKSSEFNGSLDREARRAVRKLIPLLRLANALDRTHYNVVDAVTSRVRGDRVEIHVHTTKDTELELWTARRECAYFEREYGVAVKVGLHAAFDREE